MGTTPHEIFEKPVPGSRCVPIRVTSGGLLSRDLPVEFYELVDLWKDLLRGGIAHKGSHVLHEAPA
jgi:hypothetical protein